MAKKKFELEDFVDVDVGVSATRADAIEVEKAEIVATRVRVFNKFPTLLHTPYRLAICGEAPGTDETAQGAPFVGMSGRFFSALLSQAGIAREACFIGNVMQYQPPHAYRKGKRVQLSPFDSWSTTTQGNVEDARLPLLQEGIAQLREDLEEFKPNCVLLLGSAALQAFTERPDIGNWRGSIMSGTLLGGISHNYKCLPSWHPAACLRNYEYTAVLLFDLYKAKQQAHFPEIHYPQRELEVAMSADRIVERLDHLYETKPLVSFDIEGYVSLMTCVGLSTASNDAFIVPFTRKGQGPMWTLEEEARIWRALCRVLEDPQIPKVLQNSLYDRFVLHYGYGIVVRGVQDDTMLKHWEKFCELEKSLAFLCSIYTAEPFYKSDRKSDDDDTYWRYCCKDAACTYEINKAIRLDPAQTAHYQFNVDCLNPLLYMELQGIRYDKAKAKERLNEINNHIYTLQYALDTESGFGFTTADTKESILTRVQGILCYKSDPERSKKGNEAAYAWAKEVLTRDSGVSVLTTQELARLNIECGLDMNVKGEAFKTFLYTTLGLPVQKNRATNAISTDNESLLNLIKTIKKGVQVPTNDMSNWVGSSKYFPENVITETRYVKDHEKKLRVIETAISIMELRTRAQMLEIKCDPDGRVRCGYNVVGTVTGRLSSYTSPTGSGYNLQTIPDDYNSLPEGHPLRQGMRDLFLADDGYLMCQCDLKGSDGWTIGAHLAALGDRSMLDDLRGGIKPAARICFMLRHGNDSLRGKDRLEVKELLREVKGDDWDYFACKVGIWGICYLMGPDLLSAQISEESYGKVNLNRTEVSRFRDAVFDGYRIKLWHDAMTRRLAKSPTLTSPSGNTRRFYGRKDDILGEALASEPQNTTTYATNLAMLNLWKDEANRIPCFDKDPIEYRDSKNTGSILRIQPLHSVHDALITQFRDEDRTWATSKIQSYFDNVIIIAGIPITIPFEGKVGRSWGTLTEKLE